MKITVLTLFPDMICPFTEDSIIKRAQLKESVEIEFINFRDFASDKHMSVDDKPYGGGAGMLLMMEPIVKALNSITYKEGSVKKILTSAKGTPYNQKKALEFSQLSHLVIICGHYEGFDERIMDYVDEEVSLGDFVMTGGEITAAAIIDSVTRLIGGVLKKEEATQEESFFTVPLVELQKIVGETPELRKLQQNGITNVQLLEYPHYTRPEEYEGKKVPEVLLGGNHKEIQKWRIQNAWKQTRAKRPDLLDK
jgi:tRNA (guanine37-N1)-methyltransferase